MRIAFWASSEDGSSWYRCSQPADALRWLDHYVWSSKILPDSVKRYSDVIVGSRIAAPGPSQTWHELKNAGKFLVMDFDDDYWHLAPEHKGAYDFWNQPGILDQLTENVRLADRVTCASTGLADVLSTMHPDVRVVPNGLHASWLAAPRTYDTTKVRIGWAGTSSTITELPLVARALNRIIDYTAGGRVNVELVFIGAIPEALRAMGIEPHSRIRTIEWIDGTVNYLRAVMGFDIMIAPYRSLPFTEAKFPTKALEAGFLGIPLLASAIRPYREWPFIEQPLSSGDGIILIREEHEWGKWLKRLVDSPRDREIIGRAGRARASQNIMQNIGHTWEEALTP